MMFQGFASVKVNTEIACRLCMLSNTLKLHLFPFYYWVLLVLALGIYVSYKLSKAK